MRAITAVLFFLVSFAFFTSAAMADKPDFYDRACLAAQKPVMVNAGGYWYEHNPSPDECRVHGTYYAIKLHMGNITAGQVAVFTEYAVTAEIAQLRKEYLERKYRGYNTDVWATVETIKF